MSAASVRFSSSSRSIRSINERSRSPAIPPISGILSPSLMLCCVSASPNSMLGLGGGESRLLLGARLLLVLLAPFVIGHAIDDLARLRVAQRDTLFLGRGAIPFRQAVAAEAGEVHQIDVLHIGALAQMLDQGAEGRGFELGAGLVIHSHLLFPPLCSTPRGDLERPACERPGAALSPR